MVVIVNYGLGNLRTIAAKLEMLKVQAKISSLPDDIRQAEKLILPGVGNFGVGMANLRQRGLDVVLHEAVVENKKPIFGICLGLQLMTRGSEESETHGLGWINCTTKRFQAAGLRVPHVGFNNIELLQPVRLLPQLPSDPYFYFTHSYHLESAFRTDVVAVTDYGYKFPAIVQKGNIFGCQFHPERSRAQGLELFKKFCEGNL